jgi:hypothetical protein
MSDEDEPPYWVERMMSAEPGWRAVFGPCAECSTEIEEEPVVFWVLMRQPDHMGDVQGLCQKLVGGFYLAPTNGHFLGYVKPGETGADLVERVVSNFTDD